MENRVLSIIIYSCWKNRDMWENIFNLIQKVLEGLSMSGIMGY